MKKSNAYNLWLIWTFALALGAPGTLMLLRPLAGQPIIAPKIPPRANPLAGELQLHTESLDTQLVAAAVPPAPGSKSFLSQLLKNSKRPFTVAFAAWLKFRDGFEHSFGGRDELLAFHARLELKLFKRSPSPLVVIGKQGWLFYTGDDAMEAYRGAKPFTATELATIQHELENRRARLTQHGITYLFVVAPDKQTLYPEFVPDRFTPAGPDRLAQLAIYLKARSSLHILDLRAPLLAAKPQAALYYQTDTHWNELGAFTGYQAIMQRLQPALPALQVSSLADYTQVARITQRGDLAKMLGLQKQLQETEVHLIPRRQRAQNADGLTWGYSQHEINAKGLAFTRSPSGEIQRTVIFHDSFFEAIAPFIAQHFQRAVYVWNSAEDQDIIAHEHPNVVIDECTERLLTQLTNPGGTVSD